MNWEMYNSESNLCCENVCFMLSDTSQPPTGTDTVILNGTNQSIATQLHCISAMKQYEKYSMEVSSCHFEHLCKIEIPIKFHNNNC